MLVSIIIPVYNASLFLRKCVDSIISQSFTELDIILVDDGSTDCSYSIIQEYEALDSRIVAIHKENGGVGSARNVGLLYARGNWVVFVDADDCVEADYIAILVSQVATNIDMVMCGMNYVKNGISIRKTQILLNHSKSDCTMTITELLTEAHLYSLSGPVCKLFNRHIIEANKLSFPEDMCIGEDSIFVYQYLNCINFLRLLPSYCGYNVIVSHNSDSLTKIANPKELIMAYIKVHDIALEICARRNLLNKENVDRFFVEGLLRGIIKSNFGSRKLSVEDRISCYQAISRVDSQIAIRKMMPFYYKFFYRIGCWTVYDFITQIFYACYLYFYDVKNK